MKFIADMGVAWRIVMWLRQQNHDVVHLRELNLIRASDAEIFANAEREGRVILTFDLDFGEIVAASGKRLPSVISFRLHNTRTSHVINRLVKVLNDSSEALEKGAIITVEETRHRIRRLPIFLEETE
jgi:predicted nuclease of predicted toxin-antitoxin system